MDDGANVCGAADTHDNIDIEDEGPVPLIETCVADADLDAAIRVFAVYAAHPAWKAHAQTSAKLRSLFELATSTVSRAASNPKDHRKRKVAKRREADRKLLDGTGIRRARAGKLVGSASGSIELPLPPRSLKSVAELESYAVKDAQQLAQLPPAADAVPAPDPNPMSQEEPMNAAETEPVPARKLHFPRACHICPDSFQEAHHFYDQLCPPCAKFNYTKRSFSANMHGRVCIVTGARVKIGYCIALKLLRMGATVIVTTRFPHDAAVRYAKESDFDVFGHRLFIYGIDFRDIAMVHHFCRQIRSQFTRLDVLINNAAQTVRKPTKFYEHLIECESAPLPASISDVAHIVDVYKSGLRNYTFKRLGAAPTSSSDQPGTEGEANDDSVVADPTAQIGIGLPAQSANRLLTQVNTSAALSQIPLLEEDISAANDNTLFPEGQLDRDDQQVDLRSVNSWLLPIGQISTLEMLECHVINAFAPWVLISELKPLMEATTNLPNHQETDDQHSSSSSTSTPLCDKYVVNVSAMEGQFYRIKTIYHPHTNMAKASLNMLTRTAAAGLAAINIFMTAVDTGWITDERPVEQWSMRRDAPPPLDEWDAAMRVLDPVLMGVSNLDRQWGVFLKNYHPTRW